MNPPDDWELIEEYAATGSHAAFESLVRRHAGWIYATALRRVGSADLADDVTQAAFIVLARKAGSISRRESLAAWLYRVVTYVATDALRRRGTRRRHERLAAKPEVEVPTDDNQEVIANLDAALDGLGRRDREAVVLRYFNDQTLAQIGQAQRVAASTVQRRLTRSLARIGLHLRRHGITAAPAALPATLAAIGTLTAPPSATHGLTALATAAGALTAHTAGPIGLANGAMKTMAIAKLNFATAAAAAIALLGTGGAVATRYAFGQTTAPAVSPDNSPGKATAATRALGGARSAKANATSLPATDRDFASKFKVDWQSISLSVTRWNKANPNVKDVQDSDALNIEVAITVLDAEGVLGFDRMDAVHVTRALDDAGHDVTALIVKANGGTPWYGPLRYVDKRDAKGNSHEALDLQKSTIFLKLDPRLPARLASLEGDVDVLTFDHLTNVDVPFVANGPAVEVLPGTRLHFASISNANGNYNYSLVAEGKEQRNLPGQMRADGTPPDEMVAMTYYINAAGDPIAKRHELDFSDARSESGNFMRGDPRKITARRFEIAHGLRERKLHVVLSNIDLPHLPGAAKTP